MSTEQNKALASRIPYEAINKRKMSVFDEVVSQDGVDHSVPPDMSPTLASSKKLMGMMVEAFPDLQYTIEDEVAEGDKVVQRMTARGTMKGDWMGMRATGKQATWNEIHIVRINKGKIVEHWASIDQMGMMQQLGLAPRPS